MRTTTIRFLLCLCAFLLSGVSLHAEAGETAKTSTIEITREARITANIENKSLQEALRMMADKNLFEIKGGVPAGEPVTVRFSNVTLDEALKKLMRGYNYVLVSQGTSRVPSLMVMGKVQAGRPAVQAASTQAPQAPPASANQGLVPGTYYVPPNLLPAPASPSPAVGPGRRAAERRPADQGNDPTKQAVDQQQGEAQAAKPPEQPAAGNQPQQPGQQSGESQQQQPQSPQQQQSGESPQQQSADQPQTQPAQSSGVSARDLLGRSRSSL